MATTYITLVNDLLRRLNEVTLTTSGEGFSTAKNVQAIAKDANPEITKMFSLIVKFKELLKKRK